MATFLAFILLILGIGLLVAIIWAVNKLVKCLIRSRERKNK